MKLTDTQKKIVRFLRANPKASIPDIMDICGFSSRNGAYWHLHQLEKLGVITPPKVERTGWKVTMKLSTNNPH